MKILLGIVLLAIGLEQAYSDKGYSRKSNCTRGEACPEKCEKITKFCENGNFSEHRQGNERKKWGYKKQKCSRKNMTTVVCGTDNKTYNKTKCDLVKAMLCKGVKILHFGKCNDCSEKNVCPMMFSKRTEMQNILQEFKEQLKTSTNNTEKELLRKKIKRVEARLELGVRRPVCTSDGDIYENMCELGMERCMLAAEGKSYPERERCGILERELREKTKCDEDEDYDHDNDEDDNEDYDDDDDDDDDYDEEDEEKKGKYGYMKKKKGGKHQRGKWRKNNEKDNDNDEDDDDKNEKKEGKYGNKRGKGVKKQKGKWRKDSEGARGQNGTSNKKRNKKAQKVWKRKESVREEGRRW